MLTTKIYDLLGLSRDSVTLLIAKWVTFCAGAVSLGVDLHAAPYNLPDWLVKAIQFTAFFVAMSSAQHRTSALAGEMDK